MSSMWSGDAPLLLCPGAQSCTIVSPRREVAPVLCAGRPASAVPALLAAVFSLCGMAHRLCATLALASAEQGESLSGDAAQQEALAAATLRDQALRVGLDWPRRLPGARAQDWIAGLPAVRGEAADWIARELLGQPADHWLAECGRDADAVARWCAEADTPLACMLAAQRLAAAPLRLPSRPLRLLHRPETTLPVLAEEMARGSSASSGAARAGDAGFCLRPQWQGAVPETGPWTREQRPFAVASAWDRLAARVVDLAALCHDVSPGLKLGALALGERSAIAWCEMARGLLLHWVKLEPTQARVRDYRVLAPTEWNFHPEGVLAGALRSGLPAHDAARLVVAFDPCVDFEIRAVQEMDHA